MCAGQLGLSNGCNGCKVVILKQRTDGVGLGGCYLVGRIRPNLQNLVSPRLACINSLLII